MDVGRNPQIYSETDLESFLQGQGLVCKLRVGPEGTPFGNSMVRYGNSDISVQWASDRGVQTVYVAEPRLKSDKWYDVPLVKIFLLGQDEGRMPFVEQMRFVASNWQLVTSMFDAAQSEKTHARLSELGRERAERVLSVWPTAIIDLEEFLRRSGFTCERREAPHGSLGVQISQYVGENIAVRLTSEGGWRLLIAEKDARTETWYDIRLIRQLIAGNAKGVFPFREWFTFLKSNWSEILDRFNPVNRKRTVELLENLLGKSK
ncbi:MAG: hypothetical protein ABSF29_14715 [Tepidisphaeraceae bacterium]|jgi:hypothetical protein